MTLAEAVVDIDLYFEDPTRTVRHIRALVPKFCVRRIDLKTMEGIDPEAMVFNPESLKKRGLPENALFTARFLCETPVVVSQKGRTAAYASGQNR